MNGNELIEAPRRISSEAIDKQLAELVRESILFKNADSVYTRRNPKLLMGESEASTNGWDTVYSVSAKYLNEAIVATHSSPVEMKLEIIEDGLSLDAKFGAWQITGGSGEIIKMTAPLLATTGQTFKDGTTCYEIAGTKIELEVQLAYFPKAASANGLAVGDYKLKMDTESTTNSDVVSVTNVDCPTKMPIRIKGTFWMLIQEWFDNPENLKKFNNVFASVIIEQLSEGADFKWLKPTALGYAYGQGKDLSESVFQVQVMTLNNTPPSVHGYCQCGFNKDDKGTYMINAHTFLQNTTLPGLKSQYPNVTFTLSGKKITASNLPLGDVTVGAVTYHPKATSFEMVLEGDEVIVRVDAEVEVSAGIKGILSTKNRYKLKLGINDKQEQTIKYEIEGTPEVKTHTEIAAWVIITEIVASLVTAVIGAIVAKITETVVYRVIIMVLAALISALVGSIAAIVEKVIAQGAIDKLPSILPMVTAATSPVVWPRDNTHNLDYFELKTLEINGDILLKGIPMTK